MNIDTKRYKVTILGENYSLISDETEEHVMRAARLVDERMMMISQKIHGADEKKVAIIVALQLASELMRLECEREKQDFKSQALATLIEQVVALPASSQGDAK